MIKGLDPHQFDQKARQIKAQVSAVFERWKLIPRFKRWRLTQDPETGMVVLFGILNETYIAEHTRIPFNKYFDTHLLHDLANELGVQVVSCNSDGLRYAFILDRGRFGQLPTHIDYPYFEKGKLTVRVVFENDQQPIQFAAIDKAVLSDKRFVREVAGAFLKVFEDIKLRDEAALLLSTQDPPDVVIIDEDEFSKRVAEHEINRLKVKRINEFFNESE